MKTNVLAAVPSEDLLDGLPDSVFVLDREGRIAFVNARGVGTTGLEPEALTGLHYSALASVAGDPGEFRRVGEAIEATLNGASGRDVSGEFEVWSDRGDRFATEFRVSALEGEEGLVGVLLVLRDVTERKRYERSLEESSEKLAILNRLLRHDIRNDLNVVTGWAEELRRHVDSREAEDVLDRILAATNHSVELTRESRDLVEALERGQKMSLVPVDAVATLREEVTKARSRFPDATFEGPGEGSEIRVAANELLGSVFANLLNNAVVHNDADDPRVRVDAEADGGVLRVSVADNGPGIDPRERERIFEQETRDLESPGTGMGLYLVRYLVSEYEGDIDVGESDMGGALFAIELPLYDDG